MQPTGTSSTPSGPTLEQRIQHWIRQGYRITVRTETTAQLVRPRHFNPIEFIAMPIYLIEYLGQRDRTVYLSLEGDQVTEIGPPPSRMELMQARSLPQRLLISVAVVAVIFTVLWAINEATRA